MRGDAERKCLEAVQRCIFESSPFRNETAYTVSEDEFFENYYLYAKPVEQIFFGMSEDDIVHFENLLRLVKPNSAPSEFPDFTSDRGFVEHFQVSSSEITKRAGALHKKEYAEFQKVANQKERQLMDEMNEHPESGKIETLTQVLHIRAIHMSISAHPLKRRGSIMQKASTNMEGVKILRSL